MSYQANEIIAIKSLSAGNSNMNELRVSNVKVAVLEDKYVIVQLAV